MESKNVSLNRKEFVNTIISPIDDVVEIGVLRGVFSSVLYQCNPKTLSLIDTWKVLPKDEFEDYGTYTQADLDKIRDAVKRKFVSNNNVSIIAERSSNAKKAFLNNSLGVVYIDANHSYEFVKQDLEDWYDKVKVGGWIGGHYYNLSGVKKAVKEFLSDKKGVLLITNEKSIPSYFYQKTI